MHHSQWQNIQIYYYDPNKDALLLDCIRPLIAELSQDQAVERCFFFRQWQGGSCLCFCVLADPLYFSQALAPLLLKKIAAYLHDHPSRYQVSEQQAQQQDERINSLRRDTVASIPLVPDNTVRLAAYTMAEHFANTEMIRFLENYYAKTNELVFTIIEQTRENDSARLNACFDQLVAFISSVSPLPLTSAYMSFRSHAEAYIAFEPEREDPEKRRQRLHDLFLQREKMIIQRFKYLVISLQREPARLPSWLHEIIALHKGYLQQALEDVQTGRLSFHETVAAGYSSELFRLGASQFHSEVAHNPAVLAMQDDPRIVANRIILNFLYLHLNRIGMLNADRYILDYYIAETVETLFHISPVERLKTFQQAE